jgi:hypothetical protein
MAKVGVISKAIDKLPTWARWELGIASLIYGVYCFAHYGWTFLLRVIFSPDL